MRKLSWQVVISISVISASIFAFFFILQDYFFHTIYFANYITELIAGFLGVLLALASDQLIIEKRDKEESNRLQEKLFLELYLIGSKLTYSPRLPVNTSVWTMAKSSGKLILLQEELYLEFYQVYLLIEGFNSRANLLTEVMFLAPANQARLDVIVDAIDDSRNNILPLIEAILSKYNRLPEKGFIMQNS